MSRRDAMSADERAELEAYRLVVTELPEVCTRSANGDLEARVGHVHGSADLAEVRRCATR
jgi:hypothetical protein